MAGEWTAGLNPGSVEQMSGCAPHVLSVGGLGGGAELAPWQPACLRSLGRAQSALLTG